MSAKRRKRSSSRRSFSRGAPDRKKKPTVLVVCEGGKTEPTYFESLKRDKRLPSVEIVGRECGPHPTTVVKHAKKVVEEYPDYFDEVWCVFDRDKHERLQDAFIQARDNSFKVAFSNPCFELWYLIHFTDQESHIERGAARSALKNKRKGKAEEPNPYIKSYNKSMDVYPLLAPRQKEAVRRAGSFAKNTKMTALIKSKATLQPT
jgi:hypothetical protein